MSEAVYEKWMAQIAEMRRGKPGNPVRIDALIEDAAHLRGLDLEERADIIHGLRKLRLSWAAAKLASGGECRVSRNPKGL